MNTKAKKTAYYALCIALAFVFSYLESLIPLNIGAPGIKLGLANLVVVTALYVMGERDAFIISMIRILLCGLTFGGVFSLVYSFAGGVLSFAVMLLAKRSKRLSVLGASVLGAAVHNVGQIAAAAAVMENAGVFYYLPVLLLSGAVTGALIGVLSGTVISRIEKLRID